LQKPEIKNEYEETIQTLCTELDEKEIDSGDWTCEEIINKAAHEKVGRQRTIRGEGWFDQECAEITDKNNKAYKMMVQRWFTRAGREEYRESRKEEKKRHKTKKREYYEEQLKWMEDCNALKESRKFYKQVKRMREGFWGKSTGCRNAEGEILTDENDVVNIWKKYFQDLYEGTQDTEGPPERLPIRKPNGEEDRLPTAEVLRAIKKLKNNSAPGPDGLNAELIKLDDNKLTHRISKSDKKVWKTEKVPQQWQEGLI
jgi:hypothetical protein